MKSDVEAHKYADPASAASGASFHM